METYKDQYGTPHTIGTLKELDELPLDFLLPDHSGDGGITPIDLLREIVNPAAAGRWLDHVCSVIDRDEFLIEWINLDCFDDFYNTVESGTGEWIDRSEYHWPSVYRRELLGRIAFIDPLQFAVVLRHLSNRRETSQIGDPVFDNDDYERAFREHLDDLAGLCRECHRREHGIYRETIETT